LKSRFVEEESRANGGRDVESRDLSFRVFLVRALVRQGVIANGGGARKGVEATSVALVMEALAYGDGRF
jgi:hypothetical protein